MALFPEGVDAQLIPFEGRACGQYLKEFVITVGGYIVDINATGTRGYYPVRTADGFLADRFGIFYMHR